MFSRIYCCSLKVKLHKTIFLVTCSHFKPVTGHSGTCNLKFVTEIIIKEAANGKSETVRDAELAFLKSKPKTFESNE